MDNINNERLNLPKSFCNSVSPKFKQKKLNLPTRSVIKVMFKNSTSEIRCPMAEEMIRKAIVLKIRPIFVLIETII